MITFPAQIPKFDLGNGFYLRPPRLTEDEYKDYLICYNDEYVKPFLPDDCIPNSIYEAEKEVNYLLNNFAAKRGIYWIIAEEKTSKMIGSVNIHSIDHYNKKAEIAYEIRHDYWGRGITFAACKKVLGYAFDEVNLNKIEGTTIVENKASMCLLQKLGFALEGILVESKKYRNKFVDIIVFGVTSSRYRDFSDIQYSKYREEQRLSNIYSRIIKLYHNRNEGSKYMNNIIQLYKEKPNRVKIRHDNNLLSIGGKIRALKR